MTRDDKFLWRANADGTRQVSWRLWVLIWVTPVAMAAAAVYLVIEVLYQQEKMVETDGTVTHVYVWDNDAPQIFYPGDKIYSPRYSYVWTDGIETEATAGASHTDWNFDIGSKHRIRYWPDQKGDVVLVGPSEWWVARVIAWLAALLVAPALIATFFTRRWLGRGKQGVQDGTIRRM